MLDDEIGESMEPMEEVPLIELGEAELETYDLYIVSSGVLNSTPTNQI